MIKIQTEERERETLGIQSEAKAGGRLLIRSDAQYLDNKMAIREAMLWPEDS